MWADCETLLRIYVHGQAHGVANNDIPFSPLITLDDTIALSGRGTKVFIHHR